MTDTKNIKINRELHDQLKAFCSDRGLKIGKLVERLLIEHLKETKKDEKV